MIIQLLTADEKLTKTEETYTTKVTDLDQQVANYREKLKQNEIASAQLESRLEGELRKLLKDKEDLVMSLSNFENSAKREKTFNEQIEKLKDEVSDLNDKLSTLKVSRDECILYFSLLLF